MRKTPFAHARGGKNATSAPKQLNLIGAFALVGGGVSGKKFPD